MDYTNEEQKTAVESPKVLNINKLKVSATCTRVPNWRSHRVAISAEFEKEINLELAKEALQSSPGIIFFERSVPTAIEFSEKEECEVGRTTYRQCT